MIVQRRVSNIFIFFASVMKTKGWIPWTLHLSYDRMLRGIPGTGTRNGGMSGQLLAVNLDAIILFKFHGEKSFNVTHLLFRVC